MEGISSMSASRLNELLIEAHTRSLLKFRELFQMHPTFLSQMSNIVTPNAKALDLTEVIPSPRGAGGFGGATVTAGGGQQVVCIESKNPRGTVIEEITVNQSVENNWTISRITIPAQVAALRALGAVFSWPRSIELETLSEIRAGVPSQPLFGIGSIVRGQPNTPMTLRPNVVITPGDFFTIIGGATGAVSAAIKFRDI